ncbi:replication-associated recombination protein A [Spirochaetota bacterium]
MKENSKHTPLAERCRPQKLGDFIGQEHVVSDGKIIRTMIEKGNVFSLIFWGDPGTGKTTLAKLIASSCAMDSHFLSAISAGVSDVRKVIKIGQENRSKGEQTLLFLDEIHRFNKAQQDAILGAVESGDIILIGATTENPSFSVISPLLSRTRVVKLNTLSDKNLLEVLDNAISKDEVLKNANINLHEDLKEKIVALANGDARRMLNLFETAFIISEKGVINDEHIKEAYQNSVLYYDKAGDKHYDTISAFIKSLRGSDPNATIYYLAKMIQSGEDPVFIARRMVIFASEDIGNASPNAISIAVSAFNAVKNIGMPESRIILSQCAVFLASSPKSNASYLAIKKAEQIAKTTNYEIPLHMRNAPTGLMKKMGYGRDYKYPHDFEGHFVDDDYLPEEIVDEVFYDPTVEGSEKSIRERLKKLWPKKYK